MIVRLDPAAQPFHKEPSRTCAEISLANGLHSEVACRTGGLLSRTDYRLDRCRHARPSSPTLRVARETFGAAFPPGRASGVKEHRDPTKNFDSAVHDEFFFRLRKPDPKRRRRGDYNTFWRVQSPLRSTSALVR